MLSMITIGVGCAAVCAISKPTLISMSRLRSHVHRNHVDTDLHADIRIGRTEIGAVQRDGLARIACHRHPNEIPGADDAVGRIELDPAGARQIDLNPCMGRAAADIAMRPIARNEQIARHEARGDAETPQRLDHERRIVAAGAGPGLQGVERMLGAVLMPLAVGERLADAIGHVAENIESRGRPFLVDMTYGIRKAFTYRKRHEHGTQHPLDTLQTRSGTCRDYALFMIEALRRLGIAARFVSGYLFIPGDRSHGYVGGGSTHAWVQVYLPSAGWIEFDPTNGIVGTKDLVRVAVARDPRQAIPLHGTYLGSADAYVGMEVSINVVSSGEINVSTASEQA